MHSGVDSVECDIVVMATFSVDASGARSPAMVFQIPSAVQPTQGYRCSPESQVHVPAEALQGTSAVNNTPSPASGDSSMPIAGKSAETQVIRQRPVLSWQMLR